MLSPVFRKRAGRNLREVGGNWITRNAKHWRELVGLSWWAKITIAVGGNGRIAHLQFSGITGL